MQSAFYMNNTIKSGSVEWHGRIVSHDIVWSGLSIFVNKKTWSSSYSATLEWGLGCSIHMVYYDALILIEPSAIMSNKTAADHIWMWLSFYSVFLPFFCLSVYFEGFDLFLFINLWFCYSLLVTFAFTFNLSQPSLLLKLNAGGTMCYVSLTHSSINFSSFIKQDFLGILCISRSCLSPAPTAGHAEHQGIIS